MKLPIYLFFVVLVSCSRNSGSDASAPAWLHGKVGQYAYVEGGALACPSERAAHTYAPSCRFAPGGALVKIVALRGFIGGRTDFDGRVVQVQVVNHPTSFYLGGGLLPKIPEGTRVWCGGGEDEVISQIDLKTSNGTYKTVYRPIWFVLGREARYNDSIGFQVRVDSGDSRGLVGWTDVIQWGCGLREGSYGVSFL